MKRLLIALIGGTLLLFGLAMLPLPGPGMPIILAALAILGTEFLWARRAMRRAKGTAAKARRWAGFRDWLRKSRRTKTNNARASNAASALPP